MVKPDAPRDGLWLHATDVALVVEIESPSSRRYDRLVKNRCSTPRRVSPTTGGWSAATSAR
ncbi:hypothetical protein AB0H28_17840 [Micromonospora sp. NPDC050980]|uniref:hypothetical protein n=1 Tax=Micromonospora sp. NPDC050980 TaxID=3155161 RepID=UPI0033C87F08